MPFRIVRDDIAHMRVDAVVNAANAQLLAGGGVCGSLFHGAGHEELARACRAIGVCPVGGAVVTPGFALPARYIIHAVGPIWRGGDEGEAALLRQCYDAALARAEELGVESVAFPLISTGAFGFPKPAALAIALEAFASFLADHDVDIYLVVFDRASFDIGESLFASVRQYIDDTYEKAYDYLGTAVLSDELAAGFSFEDTELRSRRVQPAAPRVAARSATASQAEDLSQLVDNLDESFSECLLRLIDERSMTDVEAYKRANVSRKLFSKIRSDKAYRPSKPTALAFAVALRLSLEETKGLLEKAGFALSHASKFDVIVEYFIRRQEYDLFVINETLFAFDQMLLGS
ncbi:macro domain-containing protein [Arabiibacter massiliensis]|uniref:macro domain-containing protein n=1 Tax=Arabiibacter massiliensis TaxID=1870985 RepID=UPI0009B96B8C|nr:macro domain-containing protein [Arabiibacter massiliensis]